jgi:hypothetical protein
MSYQPNSVRNICHNGYLHLIPLIILSMTRERKIADNENHMLVLSIIQKKDEEGIDTDIEQLAELARLFESHAEYVVFNLLEEDYIKADGNFEQDWKENKNPGDDNQQATTTKLEGEESLDLLAVQDYNITQKGKAVLEKRLVQLKELVTIMVKLYEKKETEELYNYLVANKDWLPLMLYTQILTMNNLKKILSLLGIDIHRLRQDELQRNLEDLGIDPDLLIGSLFFVAPLAAIITFVLSGTIMRKLSEKYEEQAQERYANYRID